MKEKVYETVEVFFGMRKFILMMMIFALGIVFRLNNLIDGGQLVDLLKMTSISFFTANGFEHLNMTAKEYFNNNPTVVQNVVKSVEEKL